MKIIRRGPKDSELTHRWTCRKCGSLIEAKRSEGRDIADDRDGDAIVFKCPVCEREHWVSKEKF